MAKPRPSVVPSDSYKIVVDGETYHPHEGETVTMFIGMSVGAINSVSKIINIAPQFEALKGETDEGLKAVGLADDMLTALCEALAPRIVSWTWTDFAGRPLPPPDGTARRLMTLEAGELMWLLGAAKGETGAQRKNG